MKKQIAEHIANLVKHGHDVAARHKDGDYLIFKGIKPDGTLCGTGWATTIAECKKEEVFGRSLTIQDLQKNFTDEYEIVTEPPTLYKEGDLVDILPIAKEMPSFEKWSEEKKKMVGQKGLEIMSISHEGYGVYVEDKLSYYRDFPHWCIAPHLQEEPDDKMEEAMQLLKKNGYKVIKE